MNVLENQDILERIIPILSNKNIILLKQTSNTVSKLSYFKCEHCNIKNTSFILCSQCNKVICKFCDLLKLRCIDCSGAICSECYITDSKINCVQCKGIVCKNCVMSKCHYCHNVLCHKHMESLIKCEGCRQYVCENCIVQVKYCVKCKKIFYTDNCCIHCCENCR